jgi:hypothetical protein
MWLHCTERVPKAASCHAGHPHGDPRREIEYAECGAAQIGGRGIGDDRGEQPCDEYRLTVAAYPKGVLSDRMGCAGVLVVGMAFLIAANLILALGASISAVMFGVGLWGLHMGLTHDHDERRDARGRPACCDRSTRNASQNRAMASTVATATTAH